MASLYSPKQLSRMMLSIAAYSFMLLLTMSQAMAWSLFNKAEKLQAAPNDQFNIEHAVSVILSQQGLGKIEKNIESVSKENGFNINSFTKKSIQYTLDEQTTEGFSNNPEVQNLIREIKYHFERFFEGFQVNTHKLAFEAEETNVSFDWDRVHVKITQPQKTAKGDRGKAVFEFRISLRARQIKITSELIKAYDKNNAFLGDIGVRNLQLSNSSRTPLQVDITGTFYQVASGVSGVAIESFSNNLNNVRLQYSYESPIIFPKVSLRINDHEFKLKIGEIENYIHEQQDQILEELTNALRSYINEIDTEILTTDVNKFLASGFREISEMTLPMAPEESKNVFWGINLQSTEFAENNIFLNFNGLVYDPTIDNTVRAHDSHYLPLPLLQKNNSINRHDMTFSLSTGFINSVIRAASDRGYFEKYPLEDGVTMKITKPPYMYLDHNNKLKMELSVEYNVKGFKGWFVKNPLAIDVEMFLSLKTGRVKVLGDEKKNQTRPAIQMVIDSIDAESMNVLPGNFVWGFRKRGLNGVQAELDEMSTEMAGSILVDELPIPESLMGVDLEPVDFSIDNNGHILIYTKMRI